MSLSEALHNDLSIWLNKAREVEDAISDLTDEAAAEKLEQRLRRYYIIINQKAALLQLLNSYTSRKDFGKWSVFMSYCWVNSAEAAGVGHVNNDGECGPCDPRQLARELSAAGYQTWLDVDRLGDASPLYEELVKGILPCANLEFKYVHKLDIPIVIVIVGAKPCDWSRSSIGFMASDTLYINATTATFSAVVDRVKKAVHPYADFTPMSLLSPAPRDPFKDLMEAAKRNDPEAQFKLAVTLDPTFGYEGSRDWAAAAHGRRPKDMQRHNTPWPTITLADGLEKNEREAFSWYKLAAEQGQGAPLAPVRLGWLLRNGIPYEANEQESFKWFKRGADQGDPVAQCNLGECYHIGWAIEPDLEEAARMFRLTADQGWRGGQNCLGFCYLKGLGVERDEGVAVTLFLKAAGQQQYLAARNLAFCFAEGVGVEKDAAKAREWEQTAMGYQRDEAGWECEMGDFFLHGCGVHQDEREGFKWFMRAAQRGSPHACWRVGRCYAQGRGTDRDDDLAVHWLRRAADQGHAQAEAALEELLCRMGKEI
ncbi:Leucine-rich repeat serine/threonine-protein kinase 2 [Rhizophlyctis rosea]|nr:Leucine-rich repeat serine/threonine-protein kinase 2 [Rhizophlyctis rosea]